MRADEFASAGLSLSPYAGLAARTGLPLRRVVELATQDRLGELFDARGFVGKPLTPQEALGRLYKQRYAPGEKPRSPAEALGELRALRTIWRAEERAFTRRDRDPREALAALEAMRA